MRIVFKTNKRDQTEKVLILDKLKNILTAQEVNFIVKKDFFSIGIFNILVKRNLSHIKDIFG